MPYTFENKDNKVIFTITVPKDQVEEAMRTTAVKLSQETKIPGFRPGKADYETIKKRLGEMKILEASIEGIIRDHFVKALLEENLETVGQPYFNVDKMAPGNDLVFTAEIAIYPAVTKIADYSKAVVEKNDTTVKQETIEQAKRDLTLMQTKEVRAEKGYSLKKGDKVVVALGMKKDGVVLEGGESQNHGIFTGEEHYIPGFVDQVIGLKEGDKKTFTLKFPEEHYQKHLSGSDVDFDVEVNEIFKLEAPKINDEFAKKLGVKDAVALEEKLRENIQAENEHEERLRQDKAVLDMLAEQSTFEKIPDILINQEIEKMLHELKHQVNTQNVEFEDYLKRIKKTLAELKLDFAKPALIRIKVAILLKEIAKKENIMIDQKELDAELDKIAEQYKDNEEARKKVYEPQYRDYIEHQLKNRKTIDLLKSKMIK